MLPASMMMPKRGELILLKARTRQRNKATTEAAERKIRKLGWYCLGLSGEKGVREKMKRGGEEARRGSLAVASMATAR